MASSAPASHLIELADPPVPSRSYPILDNRSGKAENLGYMPEHCRGVGRGFWFLLAIGLQIL